MNHVHTQFILFVSIVIAHPAPLGWGHSLPYQGSLTSDLLSLLVKFGLCAFCHSKLQEDIFHPVKLVQIIFHVGYGVWSMASVLWHHIEVDERAEASESTFERYCLGTSWLAKSHGENSQNTMLQTPHLFPLPLCNLAVGLFGTKNPGYGGNAFQTSSNACSRPWFFRKASIQSIICLNSLR